MITQQPRWAAPVWCALLILVVVWAVAGCEEPSSPDTPDDPDTPTVVVPPSGPDHPPPNWPDNLPPPTINGVVPVTVLGLDSVNSAVAARPSFDYFSWQSFIALNWPAVSGQRGRADQPNDATVFLNASDDAARVWDTYKESWELFHQDDQRPTPWNSFDVPVNPCGGAAPGARTFLMAAKTGTLLDLNEAQSFPLIDQDSNYVYFEIRFDSTQYQFIRGPDSDSTKWLYQIKNLFRAEPLQMPASTSDPYFLGAMMLKAGWKILTDRDDPSRFYQTTAEVYDPQTKTCSTATLGLVAFHIAQKLEAFPEWVWSTFEQIDNVPDSVLGTTGPYSFNNGTNDPPTQGGFANRPPSKSPQLQPKNERTPVQVTRLNPIPDTPEASTRYMNEVYRKLLENTVWNKYHLVMTQWPSDTSGFMLPDAGGIYPTNAGHAFPEAGAVNTAAETYFQSGRDAAGAGGSPGGNSCMGCHYRGAAKADFSWSLLLRAH